MSPTALFRPVPTHSEPVGTAETRGLPSCSDRSDPFRPEFGNLGENEGVRASIRGWLAQLPPVPPPPPAVPPEVVAARAAELLRWVEVAWTAWQAPEVEVLPVHVDEAEPEAVAPPCDDAADDWAEVDAWLAACDRAKHARADR